MSVFNVLGAATAMILNPPVLPEMQYPEIGWLIGPNVQITQEGVALGPTNDVEYRRTLMTLKCLDWVLEGSEEVYLTFVRDQKDKLTREQFRTLHEQGMEILTSGYDGMSEKEMREAMYAALILGDIGKSEEARTRFAPYGAKAPDHDDFHAEVMGILQDHPKLCPTFAALSGKGKRLLVESANLAHYGHITHLEGGPAMFSELMKRHVTGVPLAFDFFVHTCDVAGALGHIDSESSLVYTDSAHRAMQAVKSACTEKNEQAAYDAYLATRAGWLGLNVTNRIERVLTRVGAMLRLFTSEEGQQLKAAVARLDDEDQKRIIEQLDAPDDFARTPTYMPAVLVNLGLENGVKFGLPFIARVLEADKKSDRDKSAPLNFNSAAGVAKRSPEAMQGDFIIEENGTIVLQTEVLFPVQ